MCANIEKEFNSLSKLDLLGCESIRSGVLKIIKGNLVITKGNKVNENLYKLVENSIVRWWENWV